MSFSIRASRCFPVQCYVTYNAGPFQPQGTIWNISSTGWRLSGDLPIRPGEPLSLIVTPPNEQRIEIHEGTAIPLHSTSFRSFPPMPRCAMLFSKRTFTG